MTTLLQISWRMWQWKNFENRPVFDEVMCRQRRLTFLAHITWQLRTRKCDQFASFALYVGPIVKRKTCLKRSMSAEISPRTLLWELPMLPKFQSWMGRNPFSCPCQYLRHLACFNCGPPKHGVMLMRAATVVRVLQDLFYVLLHVLFYLWSLLYWCCWCW